MWWWCRYNEVNDAVRLTPLAAAHFTSEWIVLFDFLYFYKCDLKKIHHVSLNCHLIRPACIVTVDSWCQWFVIVRHLLYNVIHVILSNCPKNMISSYTSHFSISANFKGTSSVNVSNVLCLKDLARKANVNFFSPYHTIITLLKNDRNTCEHLKLLPLETF